MHQFLPMKAYKSDSTINKAVVPDSFLPNFRYNDCSMNILFLLILTFLFVINLIIGCYVLVRLGYGPPNWQTALNLIVRLTTLQDCLNATRDWLENKAPWIDRFLTRLRVPKPIVIVDTTPVEDEEEQGEEYIAAEENDDVATDEPAEELSEDVATDDMPEEGDES